MNLISRSRGQIALIAIVTFICATFLSVQLISPIDSSLNDEWQCSKTAGIVTVCTKNNLVTPTATLPHQPPRTANRVAPA
jgi:hypothetical protein